MAPMAEIRVYWRARVRRRWRITEYGRSLAGPCPYTRSLPEFSHCCPGHVVGAQEFLVPRQSWGWIAGITAARDSRLHIGKRDGGRHQLACFRLRTNAMDACFALPCARAGSRSNPGSDRQLFRKRYLGVAAPIPIDRLLMLRSARGFGIMASLNEVPTAISSALLLSQRLRSPQMLRR